MVVFLKALSFGLFVCAVILTAIAVPGFGIGAFIHWLYPDVERGMSFLIGVVLSGWMFFYFGRVLSLMTELRAMSPSIVVDKGEEEEVDDEEVNPIVWQKPSRRRRRH